MNTSPVRGNKAYDEDFIMSEDTQVLRVDQAGLDFRDLTASACGIKGVPHHASPLIAKTLTFPRLLLIPRFTVPGLPAVLMPLHYRSLQVSSFLCKKFLQREGVALASSPAFPPPTATVPLGIRESFLSARHLGSSK